MPDKKKSQKSQADAVTPSVPELNDADFQYALKALLAAYQPVLEQQLSLIKNPQELQKQVQASQATCADEFAEANALFQKFLAEDVAQKLLPAQARELLGPIEQWRWCYEHIICCLVFGWLLCRWPRTFRGYAYYLYEYWKCVRQVIGNPVNDPPTAEQKQDFETLVKILAGALKPYFSDQLASVEYPAGVPDEVISGAIDCFTDDEEGCAVFERLLTTDAARALLGSAAYAKQSQQASFWFCRCWCLCSLCFGCCLARARTIQQLVFCLRSYVLCLRDCFRPLTCNLTDPQGCVAEEAAPQLGAFVVEVKGTAAGLGFNHYVLEWSSDNVTFFTTNFIYPPLPPGNAGPGTIPVVSGLLADFNTSFLNPGTYYIRMTVFGSGGAQQPCTLPAFQLFKKDVLIRGIDDYTTMDTGPTDPAARFIENVPTLCSRPASVSEVSFGECLSVEGGAFVGGCDNDSIASYFLDYQPGFFDCTTLTGWTNFWEVDYLTPAQNRFVNWRVGLSDLTAVWGSDCYLPSLIALCAPFTTVVPNSLLYDSCWQSNIGGCLLNGLYTFRLRAVDTKSVIYCDTQRLWIDNKYPCGAIRIDAVPKCADLFVSQFAHPPDCSNPWALPISGIAFDPLIDELALPTRPNDNFDYYYVEVEKQGGPTIQIPIPGAGFDPLHPCFYGTSRVGDPLNHCASTVCDPSSLNPLAVFGTLANFDLRAVDPLCSASVQWGPIPSSFTIPRGQCCVYTFKVWVYDRTIREGGRHTVWGYADWAVKICNDLQS
ncbi:MAG: hypothetical protein WA657_05415 [Candidatus Acidiferrales bacterium]